MIIRIVRMYFDADGEEEFLEIFDRTKGAIGNVEGCLHLELLRDAETPHAFATLSHWADQRHLDNYRKSELFKNVWGRVKTLFTRPAEAVSLEQYIQV